MVKAVAGPQDNAGGQQPRCLPFCCHRRSAAIRPKKLSSWNVT